MLCECLQSFYFNGVETNGKNTKHTKCVVLRIVQDVSKIEQVNTSHFRLYSANPELVRKHLLTLSVAYNLNIVSLKTEGNSLEEVFRSLTNQ